MALKTNFKKAEDSPGFLLWKASNRLQRFHTQCLADLPVTPTQFSFMTCLVFLSRNGPVTPTAVVKHSGMDKMMVSDLIKTLEKKKFVRRKANPRDGCSFLIAPTLAGVAITNAAVLQVEALDTKFVQGVEDLETFQRNLGVLASDELKIVTR